MKRNLLTLAALGLLTVGAYADDTATQKSITLQGTVASIASLELDKQNGYNTLDLSKDATKQLVALVTEKCNDVHGYKVQISSTHPGADGKARLTGSQTDNTKDYVDYTIYYADTAVTLANGGTYVTDTLPKTKFGGATKNLAISYTGNPDLAADTYADTLTLTLTAQ